MEQLNYACRGGGNENTEKERQELLEAAKPLIKYLNENYHPHVMAVVDLTTVQVFECIMVNSTEEYIED